MAHIEQSNKGGKKSLNAEVNLVSFIDLLSVCICFLLVAAVWLQIGTVKVMQSMGDEATNPPENAYELAVHMQEGQHVTMELKKGQKSAQKIDVTASTPEEFHTKLAQELDQAVAKVAADQQQKIVNATIEPHEKANYGQMIAVMDVLRKHEIVNLAVLPKM